MLATLSIVNISFQAGSVLGLEYAGGKCAPSLLIGLINMFMMKGGRMYGLTDHDGKSELPCHLNYWYPGQVTSRSIVSCALFFSRTLANQTDGLLGIFRDGLSDSSDRVRLRDSPGEAV